MFRHKFAHKQLSIIATALAIIMFVAAEPAFTAQELKVGFIPGRGTDAALEDTALELAGIEYEKLEAGDYTLDRLMEFDVIGVGVTAYDGNEDLKANYELLKVYVENGGYLVTIDFQQDSSWNQNFLPYPITLLDPDLEDDVGVILAEHNIFNTPNEITEENFAPGIWGAGDFMADGPEAADSPWIPLVTDRQNNWPIVVGAPAGKGYVVLSSLQILQSIGNTGNQEVIEVLQNFLLWRGPRGSNVKASNPGPRNGALYPDTWVTLSWWPGPLAVSHDIYVGDNFDDVNNGAEGTFVGNQTETFVIVGFPGFAYPDGLVPGTTYYWRIDEVNDAEPNSPWKGSVWNFSIPPKTAYFPIPADGAASVSLDEQLTWTPGFGSKLHTVYFGDNFDEVSNAAGGLPIGVTEYDPGPLVMARTYYWRVDEFDVVETHKGQVWSFTTVGGVSNPVPANDAVDVTQTPVLTWQPGVFADTHEVYFGSDAASLELKGSGNLGSENYEPGQLEWNTTYYWRIDEANNASVDSPWTGPLWSFTTANFLIIDDMESYNDINEGEPGSNRIYLAWVDGFDNPAVNGSVVGNANAPFAEQTIVHSGSQSMPFAYNNAVGKSEATLTLTSNRDWTIKDVDTLTIWFRGDSANTSETLYVALNGNAKVNNDDPDAALKTAWTEWNIPLQAFADQGVNLSNVSSITLGLSSVTGGTGIMYFDDIRLYPPVP